MLLRLPHRAFVPGVNIALRTPRHGLVRRFRSGLPDVDLDQGPPEEGDLSGAELGGSSDISSEDYESAGLVSPPDAPEMEMFDRSKPREARGQYKKKAVTEVTERIPIARKDVTIRVRDNSGNIVTVKLDEATDEQILAARYGPDKIKEPKPRPSFLSPEVQDPSSKWADMPMADIYKLLAQMERQDDKGMSPKLYQKLMWERAILRIDHELDQLHPSDDRIDMDVAEEDLRIDRYRAKPRLTEIRQLDEEIGYSFQVSDLVADRNVRMKPRANFVKEFQSWVDTLDDNEKKNVGDLDTAIKASHVHEAKIQKLIEERAGGQWKLVQRKLGKLYQGPTSDFDLVPLYDPKYTQSDWEEELDEIWERSLDMTDTSAVLPWMQPLPGGPDATEEEQRRLLAEEERVRLVKKARRDAWKRDMEQYDPANPQGVFAFAFFGVSPKVPKDEREVPEQEVPEDPGDDDPQTIQQVLADRPKDGLLKGYEDDVDTVQREHTKGFNSSTYVYTDYEERSLVMGLNPGLDPQNPTLPQPVRRPGIILPDDVKDAMSSLHRHDPLKYHTHKLGAMFNVSPSRVHAILRLRSLPNIEDRVAKYLRHFGDEEDAIDSDPDKMDDMEDVDDSIDPANLDAEAHMQRFQEAYAVSSEHFREWHPQFAAGWDPEYFPVIYKYAQIDYCDPGDMAQIRELEKARLRRFYSKQERTLDEEMEHIRKKGPIGSKPPPEPAPLVLRDVPQPPLRRYNLVLTDISKVKPKRNARPGNDNTFRVVVRDRDGNLRQPTEREFLWVRKRERSKDDWFDYEDVVPGQRL